MTLAVMRRSKPGVTPLPQECLLDDEEGIKCLFNTSIEIAGLTAAEAAARFVKPTCLTFIESST